MDRLIEPTALILVAIMPSPRDMEIARVLGWYRIPLRRAPKVVAVDYLAFYQPASFGDRKWCIEYIAPVRGHELTIRRELLRDEPDHPRADEEYFKLQLGPLMPLPQPIRADKWKRITFLYTTGDYLLKARTINELVVYPEERKLLWRSLRERALRAQTYHLEVVPELDVAAEVLAQLLGIRDAVGEYLGEMPEDSHW
jgi:hypothetical protein